MLAEKKWLVEVGSKDLSQGQMVALIDAAIERFPRKRRLQRGKAGFNGSKHQFNAVMLDFATYSLEDRLDTRETEQLFEYGEIRYGVNEPYLPTEKYSFKPLREV